MDLCNGTCAVGEGPHRHSKAHPLTEPCLAKLILRSVAKWLGFFTVTQCLTARRDKEVAAFRHQALLPRLAGMAKLIGTDPACSNGARTGFSDSGSLRQSSPSRRH